MGSQIPYISKLYAAAGRWRKKMRRAWAIEAVPAEGSTAHKGGGWLVDLRDGPVDEDGKPFLRPVAWRLVVGVLACSLVTVLVTGVFSLIMDAFCALFQSNVWLGLVLPLAGLVMFGLFTFSATPYNVGLSFLTRRLEVGQKVPFVIVPLMFAGSCLTVLTGGSVGKGAASMQIGTAIASKVHELTKLPLGAGPFLCACAMASALTVIFGTPLAGAAFAIEVMHYRPKRLISYIGVLFSASLAKAISVFMGVSGVDESVSALSLDPASIADALASLVRSTAADPLGQGWAVVRMDVPGLDAGAQVIGTYCLVGALCIAAGALFCFALTRGRSRFTKYPLMRLVIGGGLCGLFAYVSGGMFSGTGMEQINLALAGSLTDSFFLGKALFTLAVLLLGFKGGDIMPTLCIGATLGAFLGSLLGVDPAFAAALGMVAFFTACTNCPIATIFLVIESFGLVGSVWYIAAAAVSYVATSRLSYYDNRRAFFSLPWDSKASTSKK